VPTGAGVRLWLTGDRHHYARYVPEQEFPDGSPPPRAATRGEQMVTCGLGGAYLASTHTLPEVLTLPPPRSRYPDPDPGRFRLVTRYPDAPTSRRLGLGLLAPTARGIAWRNRGFWRLVGGVHAALFLVLAGVLGLFLGRTPAEALRTATVENVWQLAGQFGVWFVVVVAAWAFRPVLHRHLPRVPVLATIGIVVQMALAFATLSVVVLVPWTGCCSASACSARSWSPGWSAATRSRPRSCSPAGVRSPSCRCPDRRSRTTRGSCGSGCTVTAG
jgi:hypothetical protein